MSHQLCIDLALKPNPYLEYAGAYLEAWGSVAISVVTPQKKTKLYETQWDLAYLVEWFIENRSYLCEHDPLTEAIKRQALPGESLAQTLNRLRQRDFADDEFDLQYKWFDDLYHFQERHSLRCALPGSKMPSIILAYYENSVEISIDDESHSWCYRFDGDIVCQHLVVQLRNLVETWLKTSSHPEVEKRAKDLLDQL